MCSNLHLKWCSWLLENKQNNTGEPMLAGTTEWLFEISQQGDAWKNTGHGTAKEMDRKDYLIVSRVSQKDMIHVERLMQGRKRWAADDLSWCGILPFLKEEQGLNAYVQVWPFREGSGVGSTVTSVIQHLHGKRCLGFGSRCTVVFSGSKAQWRSASGCLVLFLVAE